MTISFRTVMGTAIVVGLLAASCSLPSAAEACPCGGAESLGDWCERHQMAWVAGVRLTSWELFEALDAHGHEVDIDLLKCGACKLAHAEDEFCNEHRIGFVDGMAYFSALTWSLARGEIREPPSIACPVCRRNATTHGWCPTHEVGMLGAVELTSRRDYDRAAEAYALLLRAQETAQRCEFCAVAMILDGTCRTHDATYENGEQVEP